MTPHETPPRELIKAIWLIRKLAYRWTKKHELGLDESIVSNAKYHAVELLRTWLNDDELNYSLAFNDTYRDYTRRFYNYVFRWHSDKRERIAQHLRNASHEYAKLKIYETLPFSAPHNVTVDLQLKLNDARRAFAEYWHLPSKRIEIVPQWTYEQMLQMLETGELIEVNLADK
jgi:hypothetical protein